MRADRLLSILLLLQLHGRLTSRQLAKRLEVSERTVHRDMSSLSSAGVPVTADRGVGGGWRLFDGYRSSLTALNASEIQALFVAGPSQILADLGLSKASDAAALKVTSLLPDVLRRNAELARQRIFIDVSGWKRASEAVPSLPLLQEAVWSDRRIQFLYDRGPDAEPSARLADPLGLVAKGSSWYLVARIDGVARTYRVSRIRSVEMLEETFDRPNDFDLAAYWRDSASEFRAGLPRYEVIVHVSSDALQWMQAMMRFGAIDEVGPPDDGRRLVRMHFDAEEVALHFLLGLGPVFDIVEPASLRSRIAESATAVLARLLHKDDA